MTKSPLRLKSFAAPAVAIVAAVGVIAAFAAWERTSVGVYDATPTESLLLLKAGDIADPTVDLGANNFQERTEKRIEGFDRAVLEYAFDAEETGLSVRTQIIERPTADLAAEEAKRLLATFGGSVLSVNPALVGNARLSDQPTGSQEIRTRNGRTLFLVRQGAYVYTLETTANFGSDVVVLSAISERMTHLDRPGAVLPLRVPRVE